jgi:hypothetical protein
MKSLFYGLMMVLLLALIPGCGNDKEKGMNRHRDMPRAASTENDK